MTERNGRGHFFLGDMGEFEEGGFALLVQVRVMYVAQWWWFFAEGFVFLGFRRFCVLVLHYLWKVVLGFVSMGNHFLGICFPNET